MTSKTVVFIVGVVHIFLGLSFIWPQPKDRCSPAPSLPSLLVAYSVLILIADSQFYAPRFKCLPYFMRFLYELAISVFILELALIVIWCTLERICWIITILFCMQLNIGGPSSHLEYYMLGLLTFVLGGTFTYYTIEATDHVYEVDKFLRRLKCRLNSRYKRFRTWFLPPLCK